LRFERGLVGLDEGVEPDAGAAIGEGNNGGIAGFLRIRSSSTGASLTSRRPPPSRSVKLNSPRVMAR
jgi:hypothetical protein